MDSNAFRITSSKSSAGFFFCFVESRGKVLYIEEVVVNTPSLNEGTLSIGDKAIHERIEMICKHLCNDFSDGVD
jgi:hypothetical protein